MNNSEIETAREDDDNTPMENRDLLYEIVLAIVSDPSQVKVTSFMEKEDMEKEVLQVEVGKEDRGKVIGKQGSIAYHLRSLMGLVGQRTNTRVEVRIDGGTDFKPRPRSDYPRGPSYQDGNYGHQASAPPAPYVPPGYVLVPQQAPGFDPRFHQGQGGPQVQRYNGRPRYDRRNGNGR